MKTWYVPARWEPQSYIYLALSMTGQAFDPARFSHGPTTIEDVQIEMIKSLSPFVKIRVLANDEEQASWFKQLLAQNKVSQENVEILIIKHECHQITFFNSYNGGSFFLQDEKERTINFSAI